MYDALVDSRIEYHDGLPNYAAKLGVNPSTIWRWRNRAYDPFNHLKAGRERFQVDVDLSREDLKRLSEISVAEACEIILNHTDAPAAESPQPPAEHIPEHLPEQSPQGL